MDKKNLNILPTNPPAVIPSLRSFHNRLPPLPSGFLPLASAFYNLANHLTPPRLQSEYLNILDRINACLASRYTIVQSLRAGSAHTGTGINGYCDIDHLVCISYEEVPNDSQQLLSEMSFHLGKSFGSASRLDAPAIVISLSGQHFDVVPITSLENISTGSYILPDVDAGGWACTSPENHVNIIDALDRHQNGRLRRLIRLLKAWKYGNALPINSYFLETFVVHISDNEEFGENIHLELFKILCCLNHHFKQKMVAIVDPNSPSRWGRVVPCSIQDFFQLKDVVEATAYHATLAMEAECQCDINTAVRNWDIVFGSIRLSAVM